jgi:poly-gamma-glutamate synthesis protein (capsule biosynthesis protein)
MLTANNHAADRGAAGIRRTIKTIENRNLRFAGTYYDKAQRDSIYPLMLEKCGLKIALLNYTYGTNGNVVSKPNIVNMIDTSLIIKDINKAKELKADITVACVHWGEEYFTKSNSAQQKLARLLVRNGVDLIIGGHPHVVQEAELIENQDSIIVPVFYSLGNSISNQRKLNTDGGIMVKVKISNTTKQIFSVEYLPVYVHKGVLRGKYQYHLIPTTDFVRNPLDFPISRADSLSLTIFDKNTRNRLQNIGIIQ